MQPDKTGLTQVEKQRYELLQLLLFLIMVFLGIITYTSIQQGGGYLIPSLTILSLLACLYVIAKERGLKKLQAQLVEEVITKRNLVRKLDQDLKEEKVQLEEEKGKASKLESRLKELTALYRAISTVNSIRDSKRTYDTVLSAAIDLVEGDGGSVMLTDDNEEHLFVTSSKGLSNYTYTAAGTLQKVGEGIAGWVARHCKPLMVTEELKDDERFKHLILRDEDIRCAMSIPLHVRGKVLGVINLSISRTGSKKEFTEYDLRMASIFAQHAAVTLENSQLISAIHKIKASLQPA
jgi:GAF domain-containing protein